MRRRVALLLALPLVLAGGSGAAALRPWGEDGGEAAGARRAGSTLPTARVERRDLVRRERLTGELGLGDERPVHARGAGTITRLPAVGQTVRRGEPLFEVDGRPVVLLSGARPAWRPLRTGVRGRDVLQLERNLAALGHGEIAVDGRYTAATARAVREWQRDVGLEATGVVEPGQVVFLPGGRRGVTSLAVGVGQALQAGTELMRTASTRRTVTVELEADRQSLARRGARVRVELPDGARARGRIASVATAATGGSGEGDGGGGEGGGGSSGEGEDPTLEATIELEGRLRTRLEKASVAVELAAEAERDVLAVPVTALLARRGGYAVETPGLAGEPRLVPVRPGLYADGWVSVRGRGLREGMPVVVAA